MVLKGVSDNGQHCQDVAILPEISSAYASCLEQTKIELDAVPELDDVKNDLAIWLATREKNTRYFLRNKLISLAE